jgi:peptidoglycan/xylan/chitin deacetylase (PgdA/CDA1 family)
MSPDCFRSIVRYLKKKYQIVQLEEYLLNPGNYKKEKPFGAIVFDDGYKDYLKYAYPVLKDEQCPSSMYVVVDSVNTGIAPWTYNLDYVIINTKKQSLTIDHERMPKEMQKNNWESIAERIEFGKRLKPLLKTLSNSNRMEIYQQILSALDDVELSAGLMLSWEELYYLKEEGVEIGSHTMSHPLLSMVEDDLTLNKELKNSFLLLKEKLGVAPLTISYPNGSYDQKVIQIAQEVGYRFGLAVKQRSYREQNNLFEIPRIDMYDGHLWKVRLKLYSVRDCLDRIF